MLSTTDTTATEQIAPLRERLGRAGWEFDFFKAVWLLEQITDDSVRVGGRGPAKQEAIHFRPHISLGFPPTDVRRVQEYRAEGGVSRFRMDVTFMGLYGVSTPLPLHYAFWILRSVQPETEPPEKLETGAIPRFDELDSHPLRDYLDIFHHRLVSLFYRAWTKYRYDMVFSMPGRDVLTDYLLWLIGVPPDCDSEVLGVEPIRLLRYAGVLTQHPRSAATLEGVLADYWKGLDVRVEQFTGRWVALHEADCNRLGGVNCGLGVDLTVGEQVYDLSGAFNVALGPVEWGEYLTLLPDGTRHAQTRSLVRLYQADPLAFTLEVRLKAGEIPETRLGAETEVGRLGMTSWVRTDEMPETSVVFDESSAVLAAG